jgi:hypothetical protein
MPWKINPDSGELDYYETSTGGSGGGGANLTFVPGASNGTVTSDTGTDATILAADATNAGLMLPAEKTKLAGIAVGAEVNVNADWNATTGDAEILNKPTSLPSSYIEHQVKYGESFVTGQAAYVSGSDGTNMIVSKADYNSDPTSSKTIGLIDGSGALNFQGKILTEGLLTGTGSKPLNTSTATAGDPVWLGANGTLLYGIANKPVAPKHMVFMGVVTRVSATVGEIFVKVQNGFELEELHNVFINGTLADKHSLYYDSATSLWKTNTIAGILGFTPGTIDTLTTTGTSGAATLVGSTLNIPQYTGGGTTEFIPNFSPHEIYRGITINNNSTTVVAEGGVTMSVTGATLAQTVGITSFATKQIRLRYYSSTVSGGRYAGNRGSALLWHIQGGFRYVCDFIIADTSYSPGCQQFYGLGGQTGDLGYGGVAGTLISTLFNIIGIGNEITDANLQVIHNSASGTATKIDLGVGFPANRTAGAASTTVYSIQIYNEPMSTDVKYEVINKETGAIAQGTISTNLPLTSQGLNFFASRCMANPSVTSTGQFELSKFGVYSL